MRKAVNRSEKDVIAPVTKSTIESVCLRLETLSAISGVTSINETIFAVVFTLRVIAPALNSVTIRKMVARRFPSTILGLLAMASIGVDGFVSPSSTATPIQSASNASPLYGATGFENFCVEDDDNRAELISSPERARKFRRTVYTHDDWKMHRQQDRFLIYLGSMFRSGVYENSKREILFTTAIAAFVVVYNGLRGGYTDISGVVHPAPYPGQVIGIPITAFSVTTSSLGLLLSKLLFILVAADAFCRPSGRPNHPVE